MRIEAREHHSGMPDANSSKGFVQKEDYVPADRLARALLDLEKGRPIDRNAILGMITRVRWEMEP